MVCIIPLVFFPLCWDSIPIVGYIIPLYFRIYSHYCVLHDSIDVFVFRYSHYCYIFP